jgi:hypothetical protein
MPRGNPLLQFCLKMDESTWSQIDQNRMSMVGVLHPQGISRTDYLRNAVNAYNSYFETQVVPRVERVKREIEEPLPFFLDNGLDVPYNTSTGWE